MDSWIGKRFPLLSFALSNLSRARARTILAMAGITIGVIAISSLGMFGAAFEQSQLNSVDDAIRTVGVFPGEDADSHLMDRDDVARIERYSGDAEVYPVTESRARVTGVDGSDSATLYSLSDPEVFVEAEEGEIPDNWRTGAVVGHEMADSLGVTAGDSITVNGNTRRVVAVLEEAPRSGWLRTDSAVLLPESQMRTTGYSRILVRADNPDEAFATADRLRENFNGRDERYQIADAEAGLERFNDLMAQMNTFLLGIGGVSLLVASVSILNVMLMSTIERKEEIGVLRAVGYHRLDVLRLMLNEAVLLGVGGAILGVVLSVLLGMAINAELLSDPLAFTAEALQYTVVGFLFGTLASFISGLYPAWKAANARPVEALRD